MSLVIQSNSDGSGAIQIAGSDAIQISATQNVTIPNNLIVNGNVSGTIKSGTVNAGGTNPFPSSGGPTAVDFTGIPATAKRITVMFNGVSGSGTSNWLVQAGSGTITTTGYVSTATIYGGTNTTTGVSSTAGFIMNNATAAATMQGIGVLCLLNNNTWVWSSNVATTNSTYLVASGGGVTLAGALDRVRVTFVNGTDTFDAGSINIMWE